MKNNIELKSYGVSNVSFSSDGKKIVAGDGVLVKIWDSQTYKLKEEPKLIKVLKGHN